MKLTRKHLNSILLSLPDPSLVLRGKVNYVIKIAVHEQLAVIKDYHPSQKTVDIHELTFEYSPKEMDWVIKELVI